jgi:outer membrane protein TolC
VQRLVDARAVLLVAGLAGLLLSACTLTPQPLTEDEQAAQAAADRESMFAAQEPLTKPLTLREAFRRALAYNLDSRVKVMEEALAENDLDLSRYDLLPKAYINANYTARNNVDASSSQSITNGATTVPPSRSSDIDDLAVQLNLSWNILDFGVSYVNAREQANKVLVADEERRKVVANLLQDVRRAYWRAAAAQALHQRIQNALREAQDALPAARKVETEGLTSPVDSLRYQKALLDLIGQLEAVDHLLDESKVELASLINLPPGQHYTIAAPPAEALRVERVPVPIRQMEQGALIFNPDVREQNYQTRISADETRKALLQLLPGFTVSANPNYDSNSFLTNNNWITGSGVLAGYLSNLLTAPVRFRRADEAAELADRRREAISMAVLAKLYIAYAQYASDAAEYRYAEQLAGVDQRLYQQIANRAATDVQGDLERVSAEVSAVFSSLRQYQSFAETQAALGRLYAALGVDPPPSEADQLDMDHVEIDLKHALALYKDNPQAAVPAADPGNFAANAQNAAPGPAQATIAAGIQTPPPSEQNAAVSSVADVRPY